MYVQGTYSELNDDQKTPSFFIHKRRQTKSTKLKTPMAHKTYSQEQFTFRSYDLSISFKSRYLNQNKFLNVNSSIFVALNLRQNSPFFNTNLLFLKSNKDTKIEMIKGKFDQYNNSQINKIVNFLNKIDIENKKIKKNKTNN